MWNKINRLRRLVRVSVCKTLFINFYMLPLRQAVKFPILVSRNTYFYNLSGKISFPQKVRFGMVRFGFMGEDTNVWKNDRVLVNISGNLIFKGDVRFGVGFCLRVEKKGRLTMGNNILMNYNTKIICYDSITIGDDCNVAWEVQIMDTDLHFIRNNGDQSVSPRTSPVTVGRHNWIGNRVTLLKGSKTPDYCIIASGSTVNAKLEAPEHSVIAGSPARTVKENFSYILCDDEAEVIRTFNYK